MPQGKPEWPVYSDNNFLMTIKMNQGLIHKGAYFFWKLKGALKRLLKENSDFFHEQFLRSLGALILVGWFVLVFLIIFYPSILGLE